MRKLPGWRHFFANPSNAYIRMQAMPIPDCFCWTRFGTEAGEPIRHILERKEAERVANAGVFVWGIGNAVGPSIRELVRRSPTPEVLFSPIKSPAKLQDVSPPAVVAWTSGETLDGETFYLPEHSLVTSRYDPAAPRTGHYALVCFSRVPIAPSQPEGKIVFGALRNLRTGRRIGASQVTAVVEQHQTTSKEVLTYDVAIRADLVYPYFVRLEQPVVLPNSASTGPVNRDWTRASFEFVRQRHSQTSAIRKTAWKVTTHER
jgi:hypothetical protein